MVMAMILAHLVGDYILQWNSLAAWKARELKGVAVHCLMVTAVTLLFALLVDPTFLPWALFISAMHLAIDAAGQRYKLPFSPLGRFAADQILHFTVITLALVGGGYLDLSILNGRVSTGLQQETLMLYLLGYVFVTMPAWVVVKFTAYGLVKGTPPEFGGSDKYPAMMERLLIVTFMALGQFYLIPFVPLPRLLMEWPHVAKTDRTAVYLAELLTSVTLAVIVGLAFFMIGVP
jgi:hypothetical protein